ncbi:hypothetical protein ABE599_03095 [Achromobacter mucicolens]|uniref:hypothetical protein n=1 Tax=Achromobacter mucicolens TaxID=1389922 RepID=UPI0032088051
MKGLAPFQRATLVDIQEGRVASETITIPAASIPDLLQAHGAVEAVRAKRYEKATKYAQQAAPDTQTLIALDQEKSTA